MGRPHRRPHCRRQTRGAREQPVTLAPSTGGDPPRGLWAPSLGRRAERKLYTTRHHRGAGPAPAVTALKGLPRAVFGQRLPCLSECPRGQELKPQPAGACWEGEREEASSPEAAGPSRAQRVAETKDPAPFSKEQAPSGISGPSERRNEKCFGHHPDTHSEQRSHERGQEAGYHTALVPDAKPASGTRSH